MPRTHTPRRRGALFAAVLLSAALVPGAPAAAEPPALSPPARAYLAAHPGGVPINDNQISYGDGRFIVTVAAPAGTLAAPDCPSGWFCFYDRTNFGYPRGQLSDCGWQDLAWWGWHDMVESVHYNISSGSVTFVDHAPGTTHARDRPIFSVSSTRRVLADVAPYRNQADHVYRYC